MLLNRFRNNLIISAVATACCFALDSCSMVYDDMPDCPARLQLQFEFTRTLQGGDAFADQVHSVYVWAFDNEGNFVWSGNESGEALSQPGYTMVTDLGAGTYDFIAWCGLDDNTDFILGNYTPTDKSELDIKLKTLEADGQNVSSSHFKGLYYGARYNVSHIINPYAPSITTAKISLIKDTNDIAVMLHNLDNTALDAEEFTVTISYADSWLSYTNEVEATSPVVTYKPWDYLYGETSRADDSQAVLSTVLYEMSTSRLIEDGKAWLDVVRNTDGARIIHVPLIEYFIFAKGNRYNQFSDQEYLDRQDDYSILFFIDEDRNWYLAAGIYINGWAIVPPQSETFD